MGRIGQGVGAVLLLAGLGLGGWGAPYYMLDWGSTLVISGAVLASAGLLSLLLGTALLRLAALRDDLRAMRADAAVTRWESDAKAQALPDAVVQPDRPAPAPEFGPVAATDRTEAEALWPQQDTPSSVGVRVGTPPPVAQPVSGMATAAAGVAGAGAAGALVSGWFKRRGAEPPADAAPPAQDDDTASLAVASDPAPALPDDTAAMAGDVAPQRGIDAADRASLDDLVAEALTAEFTPVEALPVAASPAPGLDLPPPTREEMFARVESAVRGLAASPAADDYDDLRDDLIGVTRDPAASVHESGHDAEQDDADLRLDARQPFEGHEEVPDTLAPREAHDEGGVFAQEDEDAHSPPEAPEPAGLSPAPSDPPPPASEEGVVAAYTVGDSAYAMLADGRIRVTTPEEELYFNSMDELKGYMMRRRAEGLSI